MRFEMLLKSKGFLCIAGAFHFSINTIKMPPYAHLFDKFRRNAAMIQQITINWDITRAQPFTERKLKIILRRHIVRIILMPLSIMRITGRAL